MSVSGSRIRNDRIAPLLPSGRAEQSTSPAVEPALVNTPYWLLWSTGIIAMVLCMVAFALWAINGAGTLFDMMVALCG
jgi:hypothetical protein